MLLSPQMGRGLDDGHFEGGTNGAIKKMPSPTDPCRVFGFLGVSLRD
jgi:hypothetical protein